MFSTAPRASGIENFLAGEDVIQFDHLAYKKLSIGKLSADQFASGAGRHCLLRHSQQWQDAVAIVGSVALEFSDFVVV